MNLNTDMALIGIAQEANEAFIRAQLAGGTLAEVKAAVRSSVYWPRFVDAVASGALPNNWLPGALGNVVAGWARQEQPAPEMEAV